MNIICSLAAVTRQGCPVCPLINADEPEILAIPWQNLS